MIELTNGKLEQMHREHIPVQHALDRATRDALLEHARMGRSVPQSGDGQVVWITPEEIFARYGLDEHGKPKVDTAH